MGKNNNQQNNQQKQKKPQKPIQETLHEQAALRLKAFIEDLKHDPMFRHRIFYPVLYKEITRGSQYMRDNRAQSSVTEVIYEYYLLKMEKFEGDRAAQIFQAILLANGPMLPSQQRFKITDADDGTSLLNPRNKDTIVARTKVFLTVLQDENLYNFVFRSTVGGNLQSMREKFLELTDSIKITPGGYKIQDKHIEQQVEINWKRLKSGKSPVVTPLEKNTHYLAEFFEHIRDKEIMDVVNFLIYMGKTRGIVTDFSYRPMTQDMLDKYTDYGLSPEEESELEFKNQLEQALNSNVLQKDLSSQLDIFIPMLTKEYAAICADGDAALINMSQQSFVHSNSVRTMPYELKEALKVKLQRSLKRISDYTKNYLTRKILASDNTRQDTFISKVVKEFYKELKNDKKSIGEISRKVLDYDEFTSHKNDLADLVREIFKNDIAYILEICKDYKNQNKASSNISTAFANAWDQANKDKSVKLEENIVKELTDILNAINRCYDVTGEKKIYTDLRNYAEQFNRTSLKPADTDELSAKIAASLQADINRKLSTDIRDYTFAERIAKSLLKDLGSAASFIGKLLIKNSFTDTLMNLLTIAEAYKMLTQYIESYTQAIKYANDYDGILNNLKEFYVVFYALSNLIAELINKIDLKEFDKAGLRTSRMKIEEIFKKINQCSRNADDILNIIKDYEKLTPEEFLKKLIVANTKTTNSVKKFNVDPIAEHLLSLYFKYYLKPVLVNFFGYALDEFSYITRKNDIESDIISKDVLHFSTLLTPRNVGVLTFDGTVAQDLAKFTYVLMADTFSGITYNSPDSVIKFLDDVYGIKYFNVIIYGTNDAYVYMNNVGVPYLYRGAKTKIPIRELRKNYDFLMDPSRGLYKNISLPKKK